MKHSGKRNLLTETLENFAQSKKMTLICALVMPAVFWLFLTLYEGVGYGMQAEFCLADSFALSTAPDVFFLGVALFTVFLNLYLQQNDSNIQYVVRHKTRQQLWCKQVGKTAILAAVMTVYVTLCTLVVGLIKSNSQSLVNFSQRNSLMFRMGRTIVAGVEFWQVVAMFCWYSFATIFVMSMVVVLSRWFFKKPLVGWLVMILLGFVEYLDLQIGIFYNPMDVGYKLWANAGPEQILFRFWYPAIWIVVLFAAGFLAAGRKEYRNGET